MGPTGARRMVWTASDAGAGLWRRLPVGMGWPGTAAPITAVRCVWGIELTRPAMAGIQAGVERYPALIRWTLYTVHWAKLYAMHGTVPYGLTPIGRSYK